MSTEIGILYFNQKTEKELKEIREPFWHCTRCGATTPYTLAKLPKYLTQLQKLAGKRKLPYPERLYYKIEENGSETVTKTKGFFNREEYTEEIPLYTMALLLEFEEELSPEDHVKWEMVGWGMFHTMKVLE